MNPEQFDLVAIGDIATDAFIRLKDAEVHCNIKHDDCEICLRFGDKIPYESVTIVPAAGNSGNAVVAATRLGLRTALISNIGTDEEGQKSLLTLNQNGIDTRWVKHHPDKRSNYHYVLWYQDDRTILTKHEEYAYSWPEIGSPKWLYLSSMGEHSSALYQDIAAHLRAHPEIKLAFQPGTFQIKLGPENLREIYAETNIFFCNTEEAQRILQTKEEDLSKLLEGIRALGPQIVVITDAKAGAYASDGAQTWFIPPYPDQKAPLERTGAGDAFAATVVSALALDKTLPEALAWGPINSMSVVQVIGSQAGLLDRKSLETYLQEAPSEYQAKLLSPVSN